MSTGQACPKKNKKERKKEVEEATSMRKDKRTKGFHLAYFTSKQIQHSVTC